ncbi:MAG TPA: hypothetical protein VGD67_10735 [Pseudonocardiaceae bacterium]
MTALVLAGLMALLLVLFGAVIGAEIQDKLHEGQRRRQARRIRQVNQRWRALDDDDAALRLMATRHLVVRGAHEADDPD